MQLTIKKRQATCHDCNHIGIKIYKVATGRRLKHPRCYVCKSNNTTIKGVE